MTPEEHLALALGVSLPVAAVWAGPIQRACTDKNINTPERMAAFLAQIGEESGLFTEIVENLNYSARGLLAIFPKHFTPEEAETYAHNSEKIANRAYGGRGGNGPEESGDGWKFRGRGLIQITGRDNYRACGIALGLTLETNPEMLGDPWHACASAAWFWDSRGLNDLADCEDFEGITKKINGGLIGEETRVKLYQKTRAAFGLGPWQSDC